MTQLTMLGSEILTAICKACRCCLSKNGHCWNCHTTMSVKELCDCGMCPSMIDDYLAREHVRELSKNGRLVRQGN